MVDITRTAKGTATSKASGTTLVLASVEILQGQSLVVGVAYDTGAGAPVVTWGNRELSQIVVRTESGAATALFLLRHINNTHTRAITCTWPSAITAKAMFATMVQGVQIQDVSTGASEASTADPTTSTAVTSTKPDTIQIAAFGSQGPPSDAVGTVNLGHTSGQRAGTSGIPPASNITIHETYEILSATGDVRATKSTATARTWANVIMAIKISIKHKQAISPTDIAAVEELFETASADIKDAYFHYDRSADVWKCYENSTAGTLRATYNPATGAWS